MIEVSFDRRTFLRRGAMGVGALWALSLNPFMARRAEGAGCYSPDGKWLFGNIQTPGMTFAITGPWAAGPL